MYCMLKNRRGVGDLRNPRERSTATGVRNCDLCTPGQHFSVYLEVQKLGEIGGDEEIGIGGKPGGSCLASGCVGVGNRGNHKSAAPRNRKLWGLILGVGACTHERQYRCREA